MNSPHNVCAGFLQAAEEYAAYLETFEGRLRLDLAIAGLEEFLPPLSSLQPLRVLDLGGGTGATAVSLARRGVEVTLLDFSPAMLKIAEDTVRKAGVGDKVILRHGDAAHAGKLFEGERFDVVLCHNVLEYADEPESIISRSVQLMRRDPPGLLSILVRNRAGEVLKAAIQTGDLQAAERSLAAGWGYESLYGGRVRLFTRDELLAMSKAARLELIAERGVRVIADYLPPQISREAEYERIFELERKLGRLPEFVAISRYTHNLFRHATEPNEDRV
ncbi:MAG: methyltransferase domain-containing protein [Candidatus Korobacteraceae bacterium]